MGIFDKFKKTKAGPAVSPAPAPSKPAKAPVPAKPKVEPAAKPAEGKANPLKGKNPASRAAIIRPLITEKAAHQSALNQYVFAVQPTANKLEIKKAIRTIYNVEPLKVRVITKRGRLVRSGRIEGRTKQWKKAIVTLKPEDKIQIYEGV